jgi:resuscitation-promoting factor RpfB
MAPLPTRSTPLRRSLLGGAAVVVVAAGAVAGLGAVAAGAEVEVLADGSLHEVRLRDGTVADALAAAEVILQPHDAVTPSEDTPLDGSTRVVVTRAISVEVQVDDEVPITVTAPVASVAGVLHHAGLASLRAEGAVLTPGWREPVADGDRITIRRPSSVVLEVDGIRQRVVSLAAEVEDLLRLHDIELGPDDLVWPLPEVPVRDDQTIVVRRVELRTETEETVLPHEEVRRETDDLERGTTRVGSEGRDGLRVDTYLVRIVDGVEVERERLERAVTEPVDRLLLVGTAAPPPPPPPPAPAPSSSGASTSTSGTASNLPPAPSGVPSIDDPVWDRLARCESNGNWTLISANGLYYGGLQFHLDTWRGVGGSGLPNEAPRDEQIRRAQILLSRSWATWGNQWPSCSRLLGLS